MVRCNKIVLALALTLVMTALCANDVSGQSDRLDRAAIDRHVATLDDVFWESAWFAHRASVAREELRPEVDRGISFGRRSLRGHQRDLMYRWDYATRREQKEYVERLIRELRNVNALLVDPLVSDFLYRVIHSIHPNGFLPGRPGNFSIHVLNSPYPNAYAFGDGTIIVASSLLSLLRTEDELAAALAHEIAHIILDHSIINVVDEERRRQRTETLANILGGIGAIGMITLGTLAEMDPAVTEQSAYNLAESIGRAVRAVSETQGLKYVRQQEMDADMVAQAWLRHSGRDTLAYGRVLARISRHLGGQGLTDRTDTHLPLAQRVERIGVLSPELRNLDHHDPEYDTQIVPVLMNAALLESSNSNFRDALSYAERIIASHWPMPDAYVLKARALRHLENTPESNARALEALGMAEQIDVELNAGVYYEKALIHFRMNRTDEAEAALLTLRDSFEWESDSGVRIRRWINDMLVRVNAMRSRE